MHEVIRSSRRPRLSLLADRDGLSTVEYVIILVLVAAIAIGSWTLFGGQVRCALGLTNDELATAINAGTATAEQACAKSGSDQGSGSTTPPGGDEEPKVKKKRIN